MRFAEQTETKLTPQEAAGVVKMPSGLLGFERVKEYTLTTKQEEAPFLWLEMVNDPSLAFLVVSPFEVLPSYEPDISEEDVRLLGLAAPEDAMVLNIVTLRTSGRATVNLRGPIVINRKSLVAKQVIPANAAEYDLHYPLPVG